MGGYFGSHPPNSMYKDDRGTIKDLLVGEDFSVTHITFTKGAVRGNHMHKETIQHDIILKGRLICKKGNSTIYPGKGDEINIEPTVAHAYKATEDSEMISICFGKRIGDNYSKDTYALQKRLID